MTVKTNAQGKDRKRLVLTIAKWTGDQVKYAGAPSFAYEVGGITIDKEAGIDFGNALPDEAIDRLLQHLYDEGFDRIGCIGCPLAGPAQMRKEFARYPKYEQAYLRAFEKMLKARAGNGKPYQKWQTADDVMRWWLSEEKQQKVDEDQLSFFLLDA